MPKETQSSDPLPLRIKHFLIATMSTALGRDLGATAWTTPNAARIVSRSAPGGLAAPRAAGGGRLAVVVHAYYVDVFSDVLVYLRSLDHPYALYVTAPPEVASEIESLLEDHEHPCRLMVCPNRGRDVLPFLKIIPNVIQDGHRFFLKIHTKKSPHRRYGSFWRRDIYAKLLTSKAVACALETFRKNPGVGMIAPHRHLMPMSHFAAANRKRVVEFSERLGVPKDLALRLRFAAGTMFFARTDCILPLLDLPLKDEDFEEEMGQVDGTMAHAMERIFAVAAAARRLNVVDTRFARQMGATVSKSSPQFPD